MKTPILQNIIQRAAVAFVDNTSLYSNKNNIQHNIKYVVDKYKRLYEAIGGLIEENKSHYYTWQWKMIREKMQIKNIDVIVKISKTDLQKLDTK